MLNKNLFMISLNLLLVIGITGCATKGVYTSVPQQQSNQEYKVEVKREYVYKPLSIFAEYTTIVYINDEIAMKGILSDNGIGKMQSLYNGKILELECTINKNNRNTIDCTVHLNNQRLGVYNFNPLDRNQIQRTN